MKVQLEWEYNGKHYVQVVSLLNHDFVLPELDGKDKKKPHLGFRDEIGGIFQIPSRNITKISVVPAKITPNNPRRSK